MYLRNTDIQIFQNDLDIYLVLLLLIFTLFSPKLNPIMIFQLLAHCQEAIETCSTQKTMFNKTNENKLNVVVSKLTSQVRRSGIFLQWADTLSPRLSFIQSGAYLIRWGYYFPSKRTKCFPGPLELFLILVHHQKACGTAFLRVHSFLKRTCFNSSASTVQFR